MPGRALSRRRWRIRAGRRRRARRRSAARPSSRPAALTEGTEVRDAVALTEAAERLGASIHAEAGWDATFAGLDVPGEPPRARAGAARGGRAPARVPGARGRAPARRAPDGPAPGEGGSAAPRRGGVRRRRSTRRRARTTGPPGGRPDTVEGLTAAELRDDPRPRHATPRAAAIVIAGDVDPDAVVRDVEALFGDWAAAPTASTPGPIDDTSRRRPAASSASSTARAPSRPRSGSGTRRCPGGTRTSTPCR